jgi:NAD(P)H-dependent FMN reductase
MARTIKVIGISGSLREGSVNRQILGIAFDSITRNNEKLGIHVELEYVDLRKYPLPLFDQDVEAKGDPEIVQKFKRKFHEADALLFATPEYNYSVPGVLKNAIDWASRALTPDETNMHAFRGKPAGIISASPSMFGGVRGLTHLREILLNLGCVICPTSVTVANAFDISDRYKEQLEQFGIKFGQFCGKIIGE